MAKQSYAVLLIEDDLMVQEINRQFMERVEGFKVVGIANDGIEGLQKVKELNPDLVILDIYMPNQDGLETLHQIRQEKHQIDIIVITAANDAYTIRKVLQNGAVDYIMKPFKFERFKQSLENYRSLQLQLRVDNGISQKELDQILYVKDEGPEQELPKGLNAFTLKQIMLFLMKKMKALSAEEVAEGVGIARVTARRYLEHLEKEGQVKIDIQYGGVGRPINRYVMDGNGNLEKDQKDQK